ncbi:MAG: hypothetical protein IJS68_03660 [Clostridia bacterium]|nr:hypothetical protein [Clostridia bacterium]
MKMLSEIKNILFLLEQTEKEKKLTVLYVGLFALFVVLLVVDMYGKKKWANSKIVNRIIIAFFFILIIAFIVAYFVLIKN